MPKMISPLDKMTLFQDNLLSQVFDPEPAQREFFDCVHEAAYTDSFQAGKIEFEAQLSGQQTAPVSVWDNFEQTLQSCDLANVPVEPAPSTPPVSVLDAFIYALTPSETNMPQVIHDNAEQTYDESAHAGYNAGRIDAFDQQLENHFHIDWDQSPAGPSIFDVTPSHSFDTDTPASAGAGPADSSGGATAAAGGSSGADAGGDSGGDGGSGGGSAGDAGE